MSAKHRIKASVIYLVTLPGAFQFIFVIFDGWAGNVSSKGQWKRALPRASLRECWIDNGYPSTVIRPPRRSKTRSWTGALQMTKWVVLMRWLWF